MKSFKLFSILLLLSTGSSANAQKFVDSIRYDRDKSVPSLVVLPEKQKSKFPRITKESEQIEQTKDVLKQVLSLDENTTLELQDKSTDFNDNQHISFYQYYKGRKVDNIRSIVHYKNGQAESVNGNFCTIKDISETPVLEESQALQYALSYTGAKRYMWEDAGNEQWIKAEQENPLATFSPKGELVIYINKDDVPILTYKFDIYASAPLSRNYVYVNAENGTIEGVSSLINDIQGVAATRYSGTRNIETQFYNGTYRLQDLSRGNGIKTFNLFGQINYGNIDYTDNNWTATEWNNINKDNAALDAHWGASVVYDYFKQKHNRNSYNNLNSPLLNYVNADLYELYIDGNNHRYLDSDNAFWDGTRMTYGKGTTWQPVIALDIIAHEITHGVTQSTSSLDYHNESGALNESFSDIFAVVIENYAKPHLTNNWIIGEDVVSGGIRNLSNPKQKGQPNTYHGDNWYNDIYDNGGVHTNSGVLNYWFYLLANGGSGINDHNIPYSVQGIGIEKAAQIAYSTLVNYLTSNSDYFDASEKSIFASNGLYCSDETEQVKNAWVAVGVYQIRGSSYLSGINATADYYIQNLPTGAIVTWSYSNNLSASGGINGNSKTFTALGFGSAWIEATITVGSSNYTLPRKNISIYGLNGTYTQSGVSNLTNKPLNSYNTYSMNGGNVIITLENIPGVTYTWTNPVSYGNTKTFAPSSGAIYSFNVTLTASGYTQSTTYPFYPTGDGIGCITSYNSSTENVQIIFENELSTNGLSISEQVNNEPSYIITLTDIYSTVLRNAYSSGEPVQINISSLRNGVYVISVYNQDNNIKQTTKIMK